MPDLQSSLETLSAQLKNADIRLKEVDKQGLATAASVGIQNEGLVNRARNLTSPSDAVTHRLTQGQLAIETSLKGLENNLDGLDKDLQDRSKATQTQISQMLDAVRALSKMVQQVSQALLEERERTETALKAAGERSQAAFARSRLAVEALDSFLKEDYQLKLNEHERTTQEQRDRLNQSVQTRFVPAVQTQIKQMHTQISQVLAELQQRSQALSKQHQEKAEQTITEIKASTEKVVQGVAQSSQTTLQTLQSVTTQITDQLQAENASEQDLVNKRPDFTVKPNGKIPKIQQIPVRLEEVLKKAKVIR